MKLIIYTIAYLVLPKVASIAYRQKMCVKCVVGQ